MNEQAAEGLSVLMDGEASEFELRRSLEQIKQSPEMGERWRRYHVTRSAMRGESVGTTDIDISGSVMAALEDEPAHSITPEQTETAAQGSVPRQERRKEPRTLWKPLASMAVAASVTAMVILGVQSQTNDTANPLASAQPQYTVPAAPAANADLVRAQFGSRPAAGEVGSVEADVIRLSQGLERYIEQHRFMLTANAPQWQADWLPEGFQNVRHEVTPAGEMLMFSDGSKHVTVCIEDLGRQTVPEGVAQAEGMIAVGKRQGDKFVTVVGDVPLMMAERIAASVTTVTQ